MHSLIRNVGKGSNMVFRHDFVGDALIILSRASSETCLKTLIFGGSEGGCISFSVPMEPKLSLILVTYTYMYNHSLLVSKLYLLYQNKGLFKINQ